MCSDECLLKWKIYMVNFAGFFISLYGLILLIMGLMGKDEEFATYSKGFYIFTAIVGGLTIMVGILICFTSCVNQRLFHKTVAGVLGLLVLLLIVASVYSLISSIMLSATLNGKMKSDIENYKKTSAAEERVDWIQSKYQCCGADGLPDWKGKPPTSCQTRHNRDNIYTRGCVTPLSDQAYPSRLSIMVVAILAFIGTATALVLILFYINTREEAGVTE